jgi:CMP/dCMP kinase
LFLKGIKQKWVLFQESARLAGRLVLTMCDCSSGPNSVYYYPQIPLDILSKRNIVIAIDGPAGSGKSTTARLVAERLGLLHIDTGAMYRAVTVKVLEKGVNPDNAAAISGLIRTTQVELERTGGALHVVLDGVDVTSRIRDSDVTRSVSAVSRIREVREAMAQKQRELGSTQGGVLEGRDIGTVVFPDADLKIFLIASLDARAQRRQDELHARGQEIDYEKLRQEIALRDELDSSREMSPLRKADDAIELDTSMLTIEQQVEFVVRKARSLMEGEGKD